MLWRHLNIVRLEMMNFKRFYGHHSLDLLTDPDEGKTLVLIGGDNGRGKTSIHEAINYALYVDDDLPGIQTRPSYFKAVSERLNRKALDQAETDYWVALELSAAPQGSPRQLRIERRWDVDIDERKVRGVNLIIYENGRPIDWVENDTVAYQDFLRSILPPKIAPYFFFDGEKIQEFAEDENFEKMREGILDILHINVYRRLGEDLKKYVIDAIEKEEVQPFENDDLYKLLEDAERLEHEIQKKKTRLDDNQREQEETQSQTKLVDEELRRIGSSPASKRDALIADRERLDADIQTLKSEIEELSEPLPLLLSGSLLSTLRTHLVSEQERKSLREGKKELQAQLTRLEEGVFGETEPLPPVDTRLSDKQQIYYKNRFRSVSKLIFELDRGVTQQILHDIGERERQRILERIEQVQGTGKLLKDALDRRERLASELRGIEDQLRATSNDPQVGNLIDRSHQLDQQLGQQEQKTLEGDLQRLQADLAKRRNQIEERQRTREATTKAKKAIQLAQRTQSALQTFIKKLAPEKLVLLRQHFEKMYGRLRKPEDPARKVEIDQDTWRVTLLDEKGRPLEKRVFSAGMKEMYALSLLWALSKASGRELPIVIDTPAGRLDTTNRRALFEKYLPYAGHQVIVLSTDTEVDIEWAKRLSPHVAKQYRLDYESENDSAVIRPGYFF